MEYDEDFYDDCPYCGCSKDAVVCPDCNSVVDDDVTCSACGYMFHDQYEDYYNPDSEEDDYEKEDDFFEEDPGDEICENCTYWQTHHLGSAYGMICQKTGLNTDPDDSCGHFSKMFHFSNYGEEGQYSFVDTEQEKKRKLYNWRNRKF
jgi:hypothetical protein